MNRIDASTWTHLTNIVRKGDRLAARLAFPTLTNRLYCAVDSSNHRHLLIPLEPSDEELRDSKSRGLRVASSHLVIQGQEMPMRYLDLQCHDSSGFTALDVIGGELADELARASASPAGIVAKTLAKWRRFWGDLPRSLLTREQFLGLFGELWFLAFWLIPKAGPAESIARWRGPFGARHDFEWQGKSIEIKTTVSTRGRIHKVNGIDQLRPPEHGELLFFSLRVREEASAANTLPKLVGICCNLLEADLESLSRFEISLARTGYSSIHDEEYNKTFLRIAEEALFAVKGDFPLITENNFVDGIPAGIEALNYEVNLNSFDHLRIAKNPAEAEAFL